MIHRIIGSCARFLGVVKRGTAFRGADIARRFTSCIPSTTGSSQNTFSAPRGHPYSSCIAISGDREGKDQVSGNTCTCRSAGCVCRNIDNNLRVKSGEECLDSASFVPAQMTGIVSGSLAGGALVPPHQLRLRQHMSLDGLFQRRFAGAGRPIKIRVECIKAEVVAMGA